MTAGVISIQVIVRPVTEVTVMVNNLNIDSIQIYFISITVKYFTSKCLNL